MPAIIDVREMHLFDLNLAKDVPDVLAGGGYIRSDVPYMQARVYANAFVRLYAMPCRGKYSMATTRTHAGKTIDIDDHVNRMYVQISVS